LGHHGTTSKMSVVARHGLVRHLWWQLPSLALRVLIDTCPASIYRYINVYQLNSMHHWYGGARYRCIIDTGVPTTDASLIRGCPLPMHHWYMPLEIDAAIDTTYFDASNCNFDASICVSMYQMCIDTFTFPYKYPMRFYPIGTLWEGK